jgi:cytochrome bd-type quinol oxidase subunit 1
MPPRFLRTALLVIGVALAFAVSITVMMQLIPAPRRSVDYMIIGGAATFSAMIVLFIVMITTWYRTPTGIVRHRVVTDDPRP